MLTLRRNIFHITMGDVKVMNKKGDAATGMLLIITIALVILSLKGMVTFNSQLDSQSNLLSEMMYEIEFKESYVKEQTKLIFDETIENCGECDIDALRKEIIKVAGERERLNRFEGAGNIYAKFRNGEFEIIDIEGTKGLKILNLFVQAERDQNKVTRNFELMIKANKDL